MNNNLSSKTLHLVPHGSDIAFLEWDRIDKSANVLSRNVLIEFQEQLEYIKSSSFKALVLISRKRKIFIAGADIKEIQKIKDKKECLRLLEEAHKILNALEDLPIPTVAAIHGACLGGGLELSLACDYRICTSDPSTRLGLPEVRLGIFPGFGGCIRMPRVVGLKTALDLILTGKSVKGKKALKIGLVDECVSHKDLKQKALEFTQEILKKEKTKRKRSKAFKAKGLFSSFLESSMGRALVYSQAKKSLFKNTKGFYPTPFKALDVICKNYKNAKKNLKRKQSLKNEAQAFSEVALTKVSKHLISLFFMMEEVKKKFPSPKESPPSKKIKKIGVLGAGTMGGGIAYVMADKGFLVEMKDIDKKAVHLGMNTAYQLWQKQLKRKKLTAFEFEKKMSFVGGSTSYERLKDMDLIIEAVVEDMKVKKQVIEESARQAPESLMATNTSSLSVTEMAKAHLKPKNFVGMHFFNPVHKMPLVEIIRGKESSEESLQAVFQLAQKIGKTPIIVKDSFGFLVNRLLIPYMAEALYLLEEGMAVDTLDHYYTHHFGMPMGPLRLLDEIGLDVAFKILNIFKEVSNHRIEAPKSAQKMIELKRFGKKTKKGFYIYNSKGQCLSVDKEIYRNLNLNPPSKNSMSEKECLQRGLFLMINEAAMALEEEVVESPQDLDLALIFGIGFPPFRGGLLKYADELGVETISQTLESYHSSLKRSVFSPSSAIKKRTEEKKKFYSP